MNDAYYIFYHVMMGLSIISSIVTIGFLWQRRHARGAKVMMVLSICTFIWAAGFLVETHGTTLEFQILVDYITYTGLMGVPIAWFLFTLTYTSAELVVSPKMVLPLCIFPVAILILIWTNDWHQLMWSDLHLEQAGPFLVLMKHYEIFFWIAIVHNYVYIVSGVIILLRTLLGEHNLYKGQAISLVVAASLPLLWNAIFVFDLLPIPHKDLTPVMFAISGAAITFGLMRFQLLTTVPFARKYLIQQLSEGIIAIDNQNRLLEVNRAALSIFGVDKNVIGKVMEEVPSLLPLFERLSEDRTGYFEYPVTISDELHVFETRVVSMNNSSGTPMGRLIIFYDVTERNKLQERLVARDRLASIGEFSSGVAHELNNPLAVIMGYSELIGSQKVDPQLKDDLKVIAQEADRATKIVEKLLTFARKHPNEKRPVDINEVIAQTLELRSYEQQDKHIKTETDLGSKLPWISGNESHLQQVIINIISNAEHFMQKAHGKGTLKIRTMLSGDVVRIAIEDDGTGISEKDIDRIFNPFFTTKDIGEGTGLGLSICYGIIRDHNGRIWAENNPGDGVTFFIELPVHSALEAEEMQEDGKQG